MHWQPACCYIRDYLLQVPVHFEELKAENTGKASYLSMVAAEQFLSLRVEVWSRSTIVLFKVLFTGLHPGGTSPLLRVSMYEHWHYQPQHLSRCAGVWKARHTILHN